MQERTTEKFDRQRYDHERYMRHREARIKQAQDYVKDFVKQGPRKPRLVLTPEERKTRRQLKQHERYMRNRDYILEQQRIYRETHKAEIRERRRKRDFERIYGKPYD